MSARRSSATSSRAGFSGSSSPTWRSTPVRSSPMSDSGGCWRTVNPTVRPNRRVAMNLGRRSQLRDELRERSHRWAELVKIHGTPLLVLEPHLVARRVRQLQNALPDFGLHHAVKALPHPV